MCCLKFEVTDIKIEQLQQQIQELKNMICQKLDNNDPFTIKHKEGCCFSLHNIALDLSSTEAVLYLVVGDKQILIAQLSRNSGGVKSSNLALQFSTPQDVVLLSVGGSVHIIGAYKHSVGGNQPQTHSNILNTNYKSNTQQMVDESVMNSKQKNNSNPHKQTALKQMVQPVKNPNKQQQINQPLRRSTRTRSIAKPSQPVSGRTARRQKQQLKNMASYFNCKQNELDDDDDDDSFNKEDEENQQSDEDDDDEQDDDYDEQAKDSNKQKDQELQQIRIKGTAARKKKTEDVNYKHKLTETSTSTTTHSESSTQKIPKQKVQTQYFSVPTRNPYV